MQDVETFRDLMDRWPSARAFAREIAGADLQDQGKIWKRRNRVPKHYWSQLRASALRRGLGELTDETLERLWALGGGR